MAANDPGFNHLSHWGAFRGSPNGDGLLIEAAADDPRPSPLVLNWANAARHEARVRHPAVRRGWLDNGPGPSEKRGAEEFVRVSWPEALDLASGELARVYGSSGAGSVFGGSYGWSSAGRFHHAQSQVHRFLNVLGGYVRSVNSYSAGAAAVIIPRVLGPFEEIYLNSVRVDDISRHTDVVLSFGGMAAKNQTVAGGGVDQHLIGPALEAAARRGAEFHLVSPLRDDFPPVLGARWQAIRPGTDVALMLALAHALLRDGRCDRDFLDRCTTGFDAFCAYLRGETDGAPKTAEWAAPICGLPADEIEALAGRLGAGRVLVAVSQSIQRAEHGEQPVWAAIVLAAMLGQIGLPGGGFCYGIGSMADSGRDRVAMKLPTFPQLTNPVKSFIPVARICDMLLNPGAAFDYNGERGTYPDIRLVYWAGGNPFHHHQDIGRLRRAFARPDSIIVHESAWTASARHADIVLPATMTVERDDIGASRSNPRLIAMRRLVEPVAEARDDYAIFSGLAERLGRGEAFTEGRSASEWLRRIYDEACAGCPAARLPDFDTFWADGTAPLPIEPFDGGLVGRFRCDPGANPLPTPSGRIEIFSPTIAGFGYPDCPGHPVWLAPVDGAGSQRQRRYPIQLISNQPATRLHSQLDFGLVSVASKRSGREPIRLNPEDAAALGIEAGAIVRAFNDRGSFLACAVPSSDVRAGTAQIATGAWFDPSPDLPGEVFCVHGNPNAVTRDAGTSRLAQGSTGQLTLVAIERFEGTPPAVRAHCPPAIDCSPRHLSSLRSD